MVIGVSSVLFILSLLGIVGIVLPKLSQLREFPREEWGIRDAVSSATEKVSQSEKLDSVHPDKLLHSFLLKTRILALKTDTKTATWLENLRKRSQEREGKFKDAYWKQLRSGKSEKK